MQSGGARGLELKTAGLLHIAYYIHPVSHHNVTKHTRARKETGADVDVAAALLANHYQQTDVMIHERRVFSAITDLILNV